MKLGIIGSGKISDIYIRNLMHRYKYVEVVCLTSLHPENAHRKAETYNLPACSLEEMLSDPQVDATVVLTPVGSHESLIRQSLEHGKHVYTEKTLTDQPETAAALVRLAKERGLYLGSAPDTFLGCSLQKAREILDSGTLGEITGFTACATRNNIHLLPIYTFLLEEGAGIALDYGVYYLTALISLLGPVAGCACLTRNPRPDFLCDMPASPLNGQHIHNPNESILTAILQTRSGITGTLNLNADCVDEDIADFKILGTRGVLELNDPNAFGGDLRLIRSGREVERIPVTSPLGQNERGLGISEMALSAQEGRPCRASGELACHTLDVLHALLLSSDQSSFVTVPSTCEQPQRLTDQEAFSLLRNPG